MITSSEILASIRLNDALYNKSHSHPRTIYKIDDIKRNFRATFACADTIREARNKAAGDVTIGANSTVHGSFNDTTATAMGSTATATATGTATPTIVDPVIVDPVVIQ